MNEEKRALYRARILLALSCLTLAAVVWAGFRLSFEGAPTPRVQTLEGYSVDRHIQREEDLRRLGELAGNDGAPDELRRLAGERELELRRRQAQEADIEAVLRARGYETVLVTVQPSSVNVLVRAGALSEAEAAMMLDVAMRESGVSGENVKIIPVN